MYRNFQKLKRLRTQVASLNHTSTKLETSQRRKNMSQLRMRYMATPSSLGWTFRRTLIYSILQKKVSKRPYRNPGKRIQTKPNKSTTGTAPRMKSYTIIRLMKNTRENLGKPSLRRKRRNRNLTKQERMIAQFIIPWRCLLNIPGIYYREKI